MRLIKGRPPLFNEIAKVFDVIGKPVMFAWGDVVYAPSGIEVLQPHLEAHERVHGDRQKAYGTENVVQNIVAWWERYLIDAEFRLEEEKLAHAAEYENLCRRFPARGERRRHLSLVAGRISSSLYRYNFTKDQAKEYLKQWESQKSETPSPSV